MTALERLLIQVLATIVLAAVVGIGVRAYGAHRYQAGYYAGVDAGAQAAAKAVIKRTQENEVLATRQGETNTAITKEKDDEIADLRRRLAAAPRLRVGPSICPDRPAPPAQAESTAGSDGADPSAGLVSSRADADFKQLIEAVEQDLSTGRACQAFVRENGLMP
jgi:hypothetical protein